MLRGGAGDDLYIFGNVGLTEYDVIDDASGFDTIRFDGVDPFTEIASVFRDGNDLAFQYTAGGTLRITDFYDGQAVERMEIGGQIFSTNADFTGTVTFTDWVASIEDRIIDGSSATDTLTGGAGDDLIQGFGGNDILDGADGADTVLGGAGVDTVRGGAGNDTLYGEVDGFTSGAGGDQLFGEDGDDRIFGESGNDSLDGGAGDDSLDGGFGDDALDGGTGQDSLIGGFGNDTLNGGEDDDLLDGGFGTDVLDGGAGDDSLDGGKNNDSLTGGGGRDTFTLRRGGGQDVITDFAALSSGVAVTDKIDLSDFGIADFASLNPTDDPSGDAVIDLGSSDRLTMTGVSSADLGAGDFLF